ncbi:hypothetical protein LTA6_000926 [Microbacterium sp. LTA6]
MRPLTVPAREFGPAKSPTAHNGLMGLFQNRPEEQENVWAGLPAEPRGDEDQVDTLSTSSVDPLTVGLGASVSSIVFPVAPPAPEAVVIEDAEPKDPEA